ncbi:MAG: hypothetical protein GY856_10170 [bacterium]|nr:hypothetical protein [bacterium]
MPTAVEEVRSILDKLPSDATLEDIQYHLYIRRKIERGLEDVRAGRVITQDEAEQKMAQWLGGFNPRPTVRPGNASGG